MADGGCDYSQLSFIHSWRWLHRIEEILALETQRDDSGSGGKVVMYSQLSSRSALTSSVRAQKTGTDARNHLYVSLYIMTACP